MCVFFYQGLHTWAVYVVHEYKWSPVFKSPVGINHPWLYAAAHFFNIYIQTFNTRTIDIHYKTRNEKKKKWPFLYTFESAAFFTPHYFKGIKKKEEGGSFYLISRIDHFLLSTAIIDPTLTTLISVFIFPSFFFLFLSFLFSMHIRFEWNDGLDSIHMVPLPPTFYF